MNSIETKKHIKYYLLSFKCMNFSQITLTIPPKIDTIDQCFIIVKLFFFDHKFKFK